MDGRKVISKQEKFRESSLWRKRLAENADERKGKQASKQAKMDRRKMINQQKSRESSLWRKRLAENADEGKGKQASRQKWIEGS